MIMVCVCVCVTFNFGLVLLLSDEVNNVFGVCNLLYKLLTETSGIEGLKTTAVVHLERERQILNCDKYSNCTLRNTLDSVAVFNRITCIIIWVV